MLMLTVSFLLLISSAVGLASFRYPPPPESLAISHYFVTFGNLDVDLDSFWHFLDSTNRIDYELKKGFLDDDDVNDTALYLWFNSYRPCASGDEIKGIFEEEEETEEEEDVLLTDKMEFWRRNDQEKIAILESMPMDRKSLRNVRYSSSCAYIVRLNTSEGVGWVSQSGIQGALSQIPIFRSGTKEISVPNVQIELWLKKYEPSTTDRIFKLASFEVSNYFQTALVSCRGPSSKFTLQQCNVSELNLTDSETGVMLALSVIVSHKFNAPIAAPLITFGVLLSISYVVAVVDMFVMSHKGRSCWTSFKYLVGNITYLTFGGTVIFVVLCFASCLFVVSGVGYHTGIQMFKIMSYWLCPFGRTLLADQAPAEFSMFSKCKRITREFVWFAVVGWWLCAVHMFCAFICSGLGLFPIAEIHFQRGLQVLFPLPSQVELQDLPLKDLYEEASVHSQRSSITESEKQKLPEFQKRRSSGGSSKMAHQRSASMYAL
eukprot:TRINITY_DN58414_c0_g1_i1.p1 TRINITY_DN58414_c0_g1~~TRINITY_DN58414_c0_g1_i1.p1  ORF type:complete len:489 (-),score=100.71 TRINITY_DN58414_c0_g1_i1:90-1556(-)